MYFSTRACRMALFASRIISPALGKKKRIFCSFAKCYVVYDRSKILQTVFANVHGCIAETRRVAQLTEGAAAARSDFKDGGEEKTQVFFSTGTSFEVAARKDFNPVTT